MLSNLSKLYISNFLTGLVFWYGTEKLFMQSIGIDAVGIGIAGALLLGFNLIFDIPSGVLADKWSRKGMLIISALAMALCDLALGLSGGLALYLVGYIFYGAYVVSTSGTYQALVYDCLHEQGKSNQYSKIMGRTYAIFLLGASVGNLASGFLAQGFGYRFTFIVSIASCLINVIVIASIKEPTFHKAEQKERILAQIKQVTKVIVGRRLLFGLTVISTAFAVVELFKGDYGQLYMLKYVNAPELIGILWAGYSLTWAFGSLIAHRLHARLDILVVASILPLIFMSLIDNWLGLVFFMVQSVASAALFNQIETRVQDVAPSSVRASVISVLSAAGRAVSIPASILLGWLIYKFNIIWALNFITLLGVMILFYWIWLRSRRGASSALLK